MTANKPGFLRGFFNKRYLMYHLLAISILAVAAVAVIAAHESSSQPKESRTESSEAQNEQRTESLDQIIPAPASAGSVKVVYDLPVKQPVVFLTIDDGWYPNGEVLQLMQRYHLPITTFLIELAAQRYPAFWHKFVSAGGHIEDHTVSHPFLTHLPLKDEINQITQPIEYLRQYGPPPDQLRPPYGDFNSEVVQAARDSGIGYVVMWNAEMRNSKLYTINNRGLKPGDIILLHWVPDLDQEIIQLLSIIQKQNLGLADLTQALHGEPVNKISINSPLPALKLVLAVNRKGSTHGLPLKPAKSGAPKSHRL